MSPPPPPMAIPIIVGYAASAAVTAGVISLGIGVSVAVGAAIVGAAATIAATLLVNAVMAKPSGPSLAGAIDQPGAGRAVQSRQPTPAHDVVVGRIKKSGPIMFLHSAPDDTGRADGYFYVQHALASHHCKAIGDIYLNDDLSTAEQFAGLVTVGKHLGAVDQVEDATFLADIGSDFEDHWLRGRANIATRLKGNASAFPNGVPNIAAIVWGADEITDPRTDTVGWTNNAILIVYWWMIWGEGYSAEDFDEDALIAAINICDERVRVLGDSTEFTVTDDGDSPASNSRLILSEGARSLDVGDGVRVSSAGTLPAGLVSNTTYYVHPFNDETIKLCTTVANAFAGNGINITDAGTGTHTLTYWDEARYKCNGSFSLDAEKREIRDQLLTACAGHALEIGGVWFLHAAAAATPVVTLTVDDLRDSMVTVPKRSLRDKINTVRAVFVNPDNNWQSGDAPPLINADYIDEDGGAELAVTLRLPFTLSGRCAQRLMKLTLEQNRMQRSVKFPAKLTAMRLRPLDGVYLTVERYEWDQEQHQVMGWVLAEDGGIDLLLQEDSADIYAWNYLVDEQLIAVGQNVTLPDPAGITAPAAVTVTTPVTPTYTRLAAQWAEVISIWLDGYDVEYRDSGGTDWTGYGRVGSAATREVSVERTTPQDFRVRAVTARGTASIYTQNLAPAVPTLPAATPGTGQIDLAWTNGAGAAAVQIFVHTANVFAGAALLATPAAATTYSHTGLAGGATRYYWLRSVNADGNISAQTASVNATAL